MVWVMLLAAMLQKGDFTHLFCSESVHFAFGKRVLLYHLLTPVPLIPFCYWLLVLKVAPAGIKEHCTALGQPKTRTVAPAQSVAGQFWCENNTGQHLSAVFLSSETARSVWKPVERGVGGKGGGEKKGIGCCWCLFTAQHQNKRHGIKSLLQFWSHLTLLWN